MFQALKKWWNERKEAVMFETAWVVEENGELITCTDPKGDSFSLRWSDLQSVVVETNDSGPWGADVWWLLHDGHQTLQYPAGASGESELLEKMQGLEGFDNEQLIAAMGCTTNKTFDCWSSKGAT